MVDFNEFNAILQREHNSSSLQNLSAAIGAAVNAINNATSTPTDYSDAYAGVALLTTNDEGDVVDQTPAERKSVPESVLATTRHSLATTRDAIKGRYGQSVIATQADYQFSTSGDVNKLALWLSAPSTSVAQNGELVFISYGGHVGTQEYIYKAKVITNEATNCSAIGAFDADGFFSGLIRVRVGIYETTPGASTDTYKTAAWMLIPVHRHDGSYVGFPEQAHLSGEKNARIYSNVIRDLDEEDAGWASGWLTIPSFNYEALQSLTPSPYRADGPFAPIVLLDSYGGVRTNGVPFDYNGMKLSRLTPPTTEVKVENVVADQMQDIDDLIGFLDDNIPE